MEIFESKYIALIIIPSRCSLGIVTRLVTFLLLRRLLASLWEHVWSARRVPPPTRDWLPILQISSIQINYYTGLEPVHSARYRTRDGPLCQISNSGPMRERFKHPDYERYKHYYYYYYYYYYHYYLFHGL